MVVRNFTLSKNIQLLMTIITVVFYFPECYFMDSVLSLNWICLRWKSAFVQSNRTREEHFQKMLGKPSQTGTYPILRSALSEKWIKNLKNIISERHMSQERGLIRISYGYLDSDAWFYWTLLKVIFFWSETKPVKRAFISFNLLFSYLIFWIKILLHISYLVFLPHMYIYLHC